MSCILPIEKQILEDLFGMKSGYVLDFSNRTFKEYIFDTLGIDVYERYAEGNLSKAKIMRRLYQDLSDQQLATLLKAFLDYIEEFGHSNDANRMKKAWKIVERLSGERMRDDNGDEGNGFNFKYFLKRLIDLSSSETSKQNKGYEFEKYLGDLFDAAGLKPRESYRVKGEQIDGSIEFNGNVYLVEAKWTGGPVNRSDLVVFADKVSRKSKFTRGIFVSHSGYVENAMETYAIGKTPEIILIDMKEMTWALENGIDIEDILSKKVRKLIEEGKIYYNIIGEV